MVCPLCKEGTIKVRENTQVYCTNYETRKDGKDWINVGSCNFHIPFNQKAFGKKLSEADMKKLLNGEKLKNAQGDILELDLSNPNGDFFTKITFAPRPEDRDF
ncbi:hypothetical protein KDE13_09205 [Campylobacter sp. faydin G-140]|uniref:hypothetical protein n=1 Tax=Campylobacter anatolicus TaxID=2829105 RepID=UPI001B8DB85B|nr:hypothetical protein [Campylobacter anatolicus]MBR8466510.1 hypothetical protein [Campylobacter anatolicus]